MCGRPSNPDHLLPAFAAAQRGGRRWEAAEGQKKIDGMISQALKTADLEKYRAAIYDMHG
jgi:hypothetical protein